MTFFLAFSLTSWWEFRLWRRMSLPSVADETFFLTHAVLSRTIDWTFCPTLWNKSLKPELMSWHPDLCTISVPVLAKLKLIWRACFFLELVANNSAYLGARGKNTKEILRLIAWHQCLGFSKNVAGLLKPEKEAFRVFFAAGAGNMWDISAETCQLIFYKTCHTSFSASCLFVFLVSSSCGKYNYLATLANKGR